MALVLCKCTDIVGFYLENGEYSIIETFIDKNLNNYYYMLHIHRYNNYKQYVFNYNEIINDFVNKLYIYNSCISNENDNDYYIQGPNIKTLHTKLNIYKLTSFIGQNHPLSNNITEIIDAKKITISKSFKEILIEEFNDDNIIIENLMNII
jgi:hypothetical protein